MLEVPDTVKSVESGCITGTVPREGLGLAQTPQGSRTDWLREALARARERGVSVTDEACALEHEGHRVAAVAGDRANRKITTPGDLAEAVRRGEMSGEGLRVGTGFDVHRFAAGRPFQ